MKQINIKIIIIATAIIIALAIFSIYSLESYRCNSVALLFTSNELDGWPVLLYLMVGGRSASFLFKNTTSVKFFWYGIWNLNHNVAKPGFFL